MPVIPTIKTKYVWFGRRRGNVGAGDVIIVDIPTLTDIGMVTAVNLRRAGK